MNLWKFSLYERRLTFLFPIAFLHECQPVSFISDITECKKLIFDLGYGVLS